MSPRHVLAAAQTLKDGPKDRAKSRSVAGVHAAPEALTNDLDIDRTCPFESRASCRREVRIDGATVRRLCLANYKPTTDEAIDHSGDAALHHAEPVGQVAHSKTSLGREEQAVEDLDLRQADPRLALDGAV